MTTEEWTKGCRGFCIFLMLIGVSTMTGSVIQGFAAAALFNVVAKMCEDNGPVV